MWGAEAIMLAAGMNVDWLREDLGLIATSGESHDVAASVESTDGVVFVPALLGLGTPQWDYGARGHAARRHPRHDRGPTSCGPCSRASPTAAPTSSSRPRPTPACRSTALRVDGGMSSNPTFTQALADATGRPVEVSPVVEATTVGAAFLAGLATGVWGTVDDADRAWTPARVDEPSGTAGPRDVGPRRRAGGRVDPRAVRARCVTAS